MAEVLLFHHAQGRTEGVLAFADDLTQSGHVVHTPDLYAGATFPSVEAGVAHAESIGFDSIIAAGVEVARQYPERLVYAGFSLGALPAQKLAQTRPNAAGALLYHGGVPTSMFSAAWPAGVPLQLHYMEEDEWAEPDVYAALGEDIPGSEVFVYPGSSHLFADSSLSDYEPGAAALLFDRTLGFLAAIG
jgi:dienelactone hydrolase